MTAQATLQCLPVNYPKPIMAKLLNNQSEGLEMMLSQHAMCHPPKALEIMLSHHAMCQPITGLGSDAIPACNGVKTLLIKEPAEAKNDRMEEGRDFSGSLA